MAEPVYTQDELRKAWEAAKAGKLPHISVVNLADVLAELDKPRYRDDLPVLYDEHLHGEKRTCLDYYRNAHGDNIQPLITTAKATKFVKRVIAHCVSYHDMGAAREMWNSYIKQYLQGEE